ncbi:ATPase/histidine kinase/DNA gyrase B/HSP90 domain protein [Marvinbryantia formatexigens DSM 14469]|uniref:histidine kinase n=2 Tax=Marvinbryantia TaxID=248744 RepID=C6LD29_9FIRM|nr:ATPase/histidine kinase/DNA gyrase B/HSP90 domain protein [Marvinbryantia formatexigens DSM 14469]SDF93039.1 two-component system, OmpR family, sensor histidine kinase VanS [Marvinbryantia formatexigens]
MAAGIAGCLWIYSTVDYFWNGMFIDWFTANYTNMYMLDNGAYVYEPIWGDVKWLLLRMMILGVMICIAVAYLTARYYARKKVRESVTETGAMIRRYMAKNLEAEEVFPPGYEEIAMQMSSIRNDIQRREQTLKEEVSRKNDLIVYLAHDLKTPLTSVIGYLSLLEEAPDMPPAQKAKYVHISLEKALRLEQLINEFFEITRYNLQQIVLEKESIDISYMLIQMADEFYPILQAHGNTAQVEAGEGLTVYGDSMKLARVFNNILKNAVAYSYRDTPVEISAQEQDGRVIIRFTNHGRTIPKQKLETIFEKFFRLDGARATNTGGAGLGLAIAREIVELHGGTVTAASAEELTTFTVTLPAAS